MYKKQLDAVNQASDISYLVQKALISHMSISCVLLLPHCAAVHIYCSSLNRSYFCENGMLLRIHLKVIKECNLFKSRVLLKCSFPVRNYWTSFSSVEASMSSTLSTMSASKSIESSHAPGAGFSTGFPSRLIPDSFHDTTGNPPKLSTYLYTSKTKYSCLQGSKWNRRAVATSRNRHIMLFYKPLCARN